MRILFNAVFILLAFAIFPWQAGAQSESRVDVLVYGGTAAGVMTAYAAAKEGAHVVLLTPDGHLGGMVTGGLSATDIGDSRVIGGYTRLLYQRASDHYGNRGLASRNDWLVEPHVAEEILEDMLRETGVQILRRARLREQNGVALSANSRIASVTTVDGEEFTAKVFVDCSYDGDLLAQSGVSYSWGRESKDTYGESLAGVQNIKPQHQFAWPIYAYADDHRLYPDVSPGPLQPAGSGDQEVQAYNFRLVLTDDPNNRLPFSRPTNYDPSRFALLSKYLRQFSSHMRREPTLNDFFYPVRIPNGKADFNNNGPISTDYIGHSAAYPDANYADKERIREDHLRYTQSLLYFLTHDPVVPTKLKDELLAWGLPKDEFQDSDHWPRELYIREGRRMIGAYVVTQRDLQSDRTKPDAIGMGSYTSDSHNVQRVAMPDGSVRNEGDMQVPVSPYEIPYRAITPRRDQVQNLLVPVCLSASHVAYSSLRMEPQFMIMGQAAGVAAAIAARSNSPVQDVDIKALQRALRRTDAVLHFQEGALSQAFSFFASLKELAHGLVTDLGSLVLFAIRGSKEGKPPALTGKARGAPAYGSARLLPRLAPKSASS